MRCLIAVLTFIAVGGVGTTAATAQQAAPKYRYWDSNWSFEDVDVGKLAGRLESIGVELPFALDGTVTVEFKVGVPLNALRTPEAYRLDGHVRSPALKVDDLALSALDADVRLRSGVLDLDGVRGRLTNATTGRTGAVSAEASYPVTGGGTATVNAALDGVPVGPIGDLVRGVRDGDGPAIAGIASGKAVLSFPVGDDVQGDDRWRAYRGRGDLRIDGLSVGAAPPLDVTTGPFRIDDGRLVAPELAMASSGTRSGREGNVRLEGAVDASLVGERPFDVNLRGDDVPLGTLAALAGGEGDPIVTGDLDLDVRASGKLRGSIADADYTVDGRVASPALKFAGQPLGTIEHRIHLDPRRIDVRPLRPIDADSPVRLRHVRAEYGITDQTVDVRNLDADIDGGTIRGDATLVRDPAGGGNHRLNLSVDGVRPRIELKPLTGVDARIAGTATGRIDWTVPADAVDRPAAHTGTADLEIRRLRMGGADIGGVELRLAAADDTLRLDGGGTLFGGSFKVETVTEPLADRTWSDAGRDLVFGQYRLRRVKLSRLMPAVRPNDPRRYTGTASLVVDVGDEGVDADVSLDSIAIDNGRIAGPLEGDVRIADGEIRVRDLRGRVGGGYVSGEGRWSFSPGRRRFDIRASQVDASEALSLISPVVSDAFDGVVTGQVVIANGQRLRIDGRATARDSFVYGIPVGDVESPVRISLANDLSSWTVDFPRINGDTYGGRTRGSLAFDSSVGGGFDMDGRFDARHVDFGQMLATTASVASFAHGDLTGTLRIGGRGIRGVNDLRGRYAANLGDTTGEAVPGLPTASNFFAGVSLGDNRFTDGYAAGSIGGGALVVDEFNLRSRQVLVSADGRIILPRGRGPARLDLEAVVSTGNFSLAATQASALASRLAINAVVPGVTIIELGRYLSNRTVFFDVSGSVNDPRLRVDTVQTARAAAERLLIDQILPIAGGGVIDGADD